MTPSREELLACEDEADAAFVENMMRETMSGQIQARRERRELAARVLYECEKRRATNADAVVHEASATASNALAVEPWELCADTFLSDIDALVEAGFLDLHSAAQELRTVSDEDWQRALDCAMSCMRPPFHISRSTMDNAMQHAFGMLSLRAVSSTLAALPASSREVREPFLRQAYADGQAYAILQCAEIARTVGPSTPPIGIPSESLHDLRVLIANAILALKSPSVAVQPVGEWRPIETAPKDETRILLFQRGRGAFEGWYKIDWPEGASWMDDADSEPEPTHWQPCLAPPSTVSSTNQPSEGAE